MKNIFFLLAIALILSCAENTSDNDNLKISQNTTINNAKSKTAMVAKPIAVVNRDTTPPKKKSRTYYSIDTSRPKDQIKSDFPFDISMTTGQREKVNSESILKKNGKPTVLLFWLTTCYPCRMELNAIKKIYPQWQKEADFNLVAISTDFQKNYENFIKRVDKESWPWEVYHDTNREFKKVMPGGLNGLPQTFIFDKNGEIVYHKRKFQSGDEHKLFAEVKKYAAK